MTWNKKVARRVSYKRQELLTISKYLSSPSEVRVCPCAPVLSVSLDCLFDSVFVLCTCVVSFSGLSIWFRVCLRSPVLSVSLDCLFDSVFVFVHLCCQFLWIVYLIPCLSSSTCVGSFSGLSICDCSLTFICREAHDLDPYCWQK
jgi:hypothetical protein